MKTNFILVVSLFVLVGCAQQSKKEESNSQEVSLRADRTQYDELRKEESTEVKKQNDQLALLLQTMHHTEESASPGRQIPPEDVREKFNSIMHKKREAMDKETRKRREEFSAGEKSARDAFTLKAKHDREDFMRDKHPRDETTRFFDDQEAKRKAHYEDERDKRTEFESAITDKRKDFEDSVREITDDFNQEYRAYGKAYDERRKGESLKQEMKEKAHDEAGSLPKTSESQPVENNPSMDEFRQIPHSKAVPLDPSDQ